MDFAHENSRLALIKHRDNGSKSIKNSNRSNFSKFYSNLIDCFHFYNTCAKNVYLNNYLFTTKNNNLYAYEKSSKNHTMMSYKSKTKTLLSEKFIKWIYILCCGWVVLEVKIHPLFILCNYMIQRKQVLFPKAYCGKHIL